MDSAKCDRCFTIRMVCRSSLEGAVLSKYLEHERRQQAKLQRYDMKGSAGSATKADKQVNYLSISSGTEEEPPDHVPVERDWSSESNEEYDGRDIGLKVLGLHQETPPRAQGGGLGERTPCRRCLLERLCCQRPNGPDSACTLCKGRIDAGRELRCSSDLRGVVPYKSKYGAHAVPGYESQERAPRTHHKKAVKLRLRQTEIDFDESLESDESILATMFDGNVKDTGWRLLRTYWSQARTVRTDRRPERIPCRFCLKKD